MRRVMGGEYTCPGNISIRILRAGRTAHSVFSRIKKNGSQRMKREVKKEDFSNQAWG